MSSTSPTSVRIVLTTVDGATDARPLARTLVEERLAACVSILPPMTSVYRWNGELQEEAEQQLVIKTSHEALEALKARLLTLHPYEMPELIMIEGEAAEAYSDWARQATATPRG